MAKHSQNQSQDSISAALICICTAVMLLKPSIAAPVQAEFTDIWWFNACDRTNQRPIRHRNNCSHFGNTVPKSSRDPVLHQTQIAFNGIKDDLKNIRSMYDKVFKEFNTYNNTLVDKLPKFKKPLNKSKEVLRTFHTDLQKYIVAMHYLSTVPVHTQDNFDNTRRTELLKEIRTQLKGLLCEVETAVNATCQTVPERIPASFTESLGLRKRLNNLTDLFVMDWSVLKSFEKFTNGWRKIGRFLPPHKEFNSDESANVSQISAEDD